MVLSRPLTKQDLVSMSEQIGQSLTELSNIRVFCEPQAISEGGLRFTYGTRNVDGLVHKSLRFSRLDVPEESRQRGQWPRIMDDPMESWQDDQTVVFYYPWVNSCPRSKHPFLFPTIPTFLKAWGAPWTSEEVQVIVDIMSRFGIACNCFPSKRNLIRV